MVVIKRGKAVKMINHIGNNEYIGATEMLIGGNISMPGTINQQFGMTKTGGKYDYIFNVGFNISDFITSVDNSFRLASMLPKEAVKVSESGISNPQTIRQLMQAGFNGFLIGECFMKEFNSGEALAKFIAEI